MPIDAPDLDLVLDPRAAPDPNLDQEVMTITN
jgi:hypothetical protein